MKQSFRTKVIAFFLVGLVLFTLALSVACSVFLRELFISDSKRKMTDYSKNISKVYTDTETCKNLIHDIEFSYNIKTYISDSDGNTINEYNVSVLEYNSERFKAWIDDYRRFRGDDNYYISNVLDDTDGINRIVFVSQISESHYIIMTKAIKGIDQDIYLANTFIVISSVILAVFGTLLWSITTKPFTREIEKMSRIAEKMSELDFSEKIDYKSSDEIGMLAKSVNSLSDSLDKSIAELHDDIEKRKQILRDLSHEIKTPITTIRGYTENIEYLSQDNERIKKYCNIMVEECDEINKLINEMLMMSKLESGDFYELEDEVSTEYIREFIESRTANIFEDMDLRIDMEHAELKCNISLVEKSIMNLIENACKYGYQGRPVDVRGFVKDGYYCFSVTNEGKEIAEDDLKHIWDVFYKGDKSRNRNNSHGIGLSIVSAVAGIHNGFTEVISENERNTFIFSVKM